MWRSSLEGSFEQPRVSDHLTWWTGSYRSIYSRCDKCIIYDGQSCKRKRKHKLLYCLAIQALFHWTHVAHYFLTTFWRHLRSRSITRHMRSIYLRHRQCNWPQYLKIHKDCFNCLLYMFAVLNLLQTRFVPFHFHLHCISLQLTQSPQALPCKSSCILRHITSLSY